MLPERADTRSTVRCQLTNNCTYCSGVRVQAFATSVSCTHKQQSLPSWPWQCLITVHINTHTFIPFFPLPDTLLLLGVRYCFKFKPYKYSSESYSCHQWHRNIECLELEGTVKDHGVQLPNDDILTVHFITKKIVALKPDLKLATRGQSSANYQLSSHQAQLTGTRGSNSLFIYIWFSAKFR